MKELDDILCRLLWGQLQSMKLFLEKNPSVANLSKKAGIRELYERWLEESLVLLAENNYLNYDRDSLMVVDTTPINLDIIWKEWDRKKKVWIEDPHLKAKVVLLESTIRVLPEILTGKRWATDVLFPNSSMELVEGIYKNNPVADYFNEVLANTIVAYIRERLKQDPAISIRIIEIGAGTGGTSAMVFSKIKPYQKNIGEYCYTDVSKAFLLHAEKQYGSQNPYLAYKIFNVEAPVAGQGIDFNGYDIVIATNVLHATKNIRQTLRNAKAMLKTNGLILLNEMSCKSLFTHLTFGLLEGWWLYEDTALRISGCPGLYPQTWQKVLESEGFLSVLFPVQEAYHLGQQIIVAESNGVIRQNQGYNYSIPLKQSSKLGRDKHLSTNIKGAIQKGVNVTLQMTEDFIKETIIEKLSESLKVDIDMIDVDGPFADYGLDSITGVRLIQAVNQTLLIELEVTSLFDYSSINRLTSFILSQYRDVITRAMGDNTKDEEIIVDRNTDFNEKQPASLLTKTKLIKKTLSNSHIPVQEESVGDYIQREPIAIIGMSGRFAKSETINELWKHLSNRIELVEKVTRWNLSEYFLEFSEEGTNYCKHGSLLDDIDKFDPLFFNISGFEATYMDPQQRIFLEESWKALEDAGYAGTAVHGKRCGIYVGYNGGDYIKLIGDDLPAQAMWGNLGNVIPARIAYYLNLKGPAITVDTACSSSLTAIHLACQSLWENETEMALVGGVCVQTTPWFYLVANRAGMLSPSGHCYTFDERADGFVPGEGVGVVILKRLKDSITDGDHIYGIIRGSGINQDGTTNGITAPSANSQESLIRHVYDTFDINPEEIQMVEAHGTGTKLGDPIEFQALTRAFRNYTNKKQFCAIGSIKTNIGHCTAASGVAGVIKVLLALKHKQIPPSLHYQFGNLNINFKESPFYVNTSLKYWAVKPVERRRAVVSSFGLSGTNVHVVIEEAPKTERKHLEKPGYLIVQSARTFEQLQQKVKQLVEYCKQESQIDFGNMSYTLLLGRKHFNHRLACVVRNQQELVKLLIKWLEKGKVLQVYVSDLEKNHREQSYLKQLGNQCIQNCQNANDDSDYVEQLSAIAELYVQGYTLEFENLFSNDMYSRIPLPTYSFARESYWVHKTSTASGIKRQNVETHEIPTNIQETRLDQLIYLPIWEEQPLITSDRQKKHDTVLIIFTESSHDFGSTVIDHYLWDAIIKNVLQVQLGNQTRRLSQNKWICNIYDPEGFETCLQEFGKIEVLYFISECQTEVDNFDYEAHSESQQRNETQLLRLIKCLKAKGKINNHIDCYIITQDNYRITDTRINPSAGGITGLAYAVAQGDYRFFVRNIDISAEDLTTPKKKIDLLRMILNEESSDRGELVKLKAGSRYKRVFVNLDTDRLKKAEGLKENGVYVILGGSGTVGGVITRYLMKEYNAKVVWIGRRPETSKIILEKRNSLQSLGELPLYIQADVTDLGQMKNALKKIKEHYTTVNGAIFSGLIVNFDNSISTTDEKQFHEILNVKTHGSINFYRTFQDEHLDFICYFSSGQAFSFSGAANLSAYASGITFSDNFIHYIRKFSKVPLGIINWGFWKSSINQSADEKIMVKNIGFLEDQEGFECFKHFTRLLRGNILHQALCIKASDPVRELMRCKDKEIISICEKGSESLVRSLSDIYRTGEGEVEALMKRVNSTEFDEWMAKLLFVQLRKLGLLYKSPSKKKTEVLQAAADIISKYDRWVDECINILEERGFVRCEAGRISVLKDIELEDEEELWMQWESAKEHLKETELRDQVRLVDACLSSLPKILKGYIPATDIIFPNSSMEMVDNIYKGNVLADNFNIIVASAVEKYVKQRLKTDPQTKVRIIEVGAGTGGTSEKIFDRLKSYVNQIEYCYTDISKAFLLFAEDKYGQDNPYLKFKRWDIEKPLTGQDIEFGAYDIAIATNVLHATKNIRQTLQNIKAALKTNGILLLNEGNQKNLFVTLTFGLLDGWWLYEDERLRIPGSPFLCPETWKRVLEEEGFREIHFPAKLAHRLGQQIIVAESDGIVRTKEKSPLVNKEATLTLPTSEISNIGLEEFIKTLIIDQLSKSLKIPREVIDSNEAFSDYGVDSIIAVSVVKKVSEGLGLNLNSAILFDFITVERLTNYIIKTYAEQITARWRLLTDNSLLQKNREENDLYVPNKVDNKLIENLKKQFFENEISAESLIDIIVNISGGE